MQAEGRAVNFNLATMIQVVLRAHEISESSSSQRPLSPHEIAVLAELRSFISSVEKKSLRSCWDGSAYCRFNNRGICCFEVEDLRADSSQILSCKWRGASVKK